ncbi:methyltransferase domain-containing protein [Telmatospirillum sp. J64-1]|uniref:class I SAM-dependent methyltransferase n=1 Tax=Telmatospirillum sp. J64-1 TaxID=2502183 RepID=UPI001C8FA6A8|nr:methyltransferase domain-containing protein [Telmatospirillum sp. J64-1]
MIKLHVGCADKRLDGYVNIDCRQTKATDAVSDAWDLHMFADGSVSEIYSRHMLEHLDPNDARRTLRRWHSLLAPGGILHLVVPDIEFHARQLLGLAQSRFPDQLQHAFAGFWGWRDEMRGGSRHDAHRWGYTESSLTQELASAGFEKIERVLQGPDSEAWHLQMLAAKI